MQPVWDYGHKLLVIIGNQICEDIYSNENQKHTYFTKTLAYIWQCIHSIYKEDNRLEILSVFGKFDWLVVFSHRKEYCLLNVYLEIGTKFESNTNCQTTSNCNQYFTRIYTKIIRYLHIMEKIILDMESIVILQSIVVWFQEPFSQNKTILSFISTLMS